MIDDGMENIEEIPSHLVLLIARWQDVLQVPEHAAFENKCKYWFLPSSALSGCKYVWAEGSNNNLTKIS